jgi:hypothetical protein
MPYTMEDYERAVEERVLRKLTPEQLLQRLSREEIEKYLEKLKASESKPPAEHPETRP